MGAGAVGSYYGALLARDDHEITLVTRGPHLDAVRARGAVAVREPDGTEWTVPVTASATPTRSVCDLVIVTTKSQHTLQAARALAPVLAPGTPVVSLQNGVDNVTRPQAALPDAAAVAGLVFVGLAISRPGTVDHHGEGHATIGDAAGPPTAAVDRVAAIAAGSWDLEISCSIVRAQWIKLLWNVGFNTLCAVTGASAGEALATPESPALVAHAVAEAVAVAAAHRIAIPDGRLAGMTAYLPAMRTFQPSTAQDIAAGKDPERGALSVRRQRRPPRGHSDPGQRGAGWTVGPPGRPRHGAHRQVATPRRGCGRRVLDVVERVPSRRAMRRRAPARRRHPAKARRPSPPVAAGLCRSCPGSG